LLEKPEGKRKNFGVITKIILTWVLKKWVGEWVRLIWPVLGCCGHGSEHFFP
jgi:hypothetical protein